MVRSVEGVYSLPLPLPHTPLTEGTPGGRGSYERPPRDGRHLRDTELEVEEGPGERPGVTVPEDVRTFRSRRAVHVLFIYVRSLFSIKGD